MGNLANVKWINFLHELSEKILSLKSNKKELNTLVEEAVNKLNAKGYTVTLSDKVKSQEEYIDPFSILGILGNGSNSVLDPSEDRKQINSPLFDDRFEAFKDAFHLDSPVPDNYSGLVPAMANSVKFGSFTDAKQREWIWELFEKAFNYKGEGEKALGEIAQLLEELCQIKNIGVPILSTELFWTNPEYFVAATESVRDYVKDTTDFPPEIRKLVPKIEKSPRAYIEFTTQLRDFLKAETNIENFLELSETAYRYREGKIVNIEKEKASKQEPQDEKTQVEREEKWILVKKEKGKKDEKTYLKLNMKIALKDVKELKDVFWLSGSNDDDFMKNCENIFGLLDRRRTLLLAGPPGVGKTYSAERIAKCLIRKHDEKPTTEEDTEEQDIEEQKQVIQFHQGYSYEDFIMGYRPRKESFVLTPGRFYEFCNKALKNPEKPYFFIIDEINRGNISKIFGEVFSLIESSMRDKKIPLPYTLIEEEENEVSSEMNDQIPELKNEPLTKQVREGETEEIDNESILQNLKSENSHGAETQIKFQIPNNVFLIGTMNTADKSLAILDYALRRRFPFYNIRSAVENNKAFNDYLDELQKKKPSGKLTTLIELIRGDEGLNNAIRTDQSLGEGFCIGHSYFCNFDEASDIDEQVEQIVQYDLVPLIEEYWEDTPNKVENWKKTLFEKELFHNYVPKNKGESGDKAGEQLKEN